MFLWAARPSRRTNIRKPRKATIARWRPCRRFTAHFCGIHIAKTNPKFQIITQHFCMSRSEEMHQCLLYDSNEKNAKLLGVEYIISDRLYRELPDAEKKYWHPHAYEVLAGGLIAPSMKPEDEQTFMKALLTTWGKSVAYLARSSDPGSDGRAAADVVGQRRRPDRSGRDRRAG